MFGGNSFKLNIGAGIERIGKNSFAHIDKIEEIGTNNSTFKEISNCAFAGTLIKEITLPSTCEKIGASAFENCTKLENVYLNEGLKEIEFPAFQNCKSLTKIKIPSTVEDITGPIFIGCTNLEKIIISKEQEILINKLKSFGYEDKLEIIGEKYIEDGKVYNKNEILANKKYVLVQGSNTSIFTANEDEIIIDEENSNWSKDEYITYLIKNNYGDYYVCETDSQGNIKLLGKTSTYTGFYNGRAYKDGKLLKDVIIALAKGTNVGRNANIYTNYDIITEDNLKEIENLKQEKDIYIIDENGELSSNLVGDDSYNVLVGDVNIDGKVDITDVIYLNKYIAGIITFNDEQLKAANCYSDNIVNGSDLIALLRYIMELEKELPIKEKDITQKQEFIDQMDDEFYNTYIKPANATLDFSQIAKLVHKEIRQESIKEEGKMQYIDEDLEIKDIFTNGSFGEGINAKAYVGLCLYEYGIHTQNEDLIKYVMEYQEQGNYRELYNITGEKLNELGWQKIDYTSKDQLKNGDIIISEKEAQIYNGNGVYSCGSDEEIRKTLISEPIEPGAGRYIIRIEPTSGKYGESIEWNLEEDTLQLEINGETNEEVIPWKASINKIATYKINSSEGNIDNVINIVGASIKESTNTKKKTVHLTTNKMVDVCKKVKRHIYLGDILVDYKLSFLPDGSGFVATLTFDPEQNSEISASANGIRTKEDIMYAIENSTGWTEQRKKNVELMMDGLLAMQSDYNIDPLVAISIFRGESGVGTAYESLGQYRLDNHRHWEGCKCSYHEESGFACYDNYSDNAYDWGNYIRNRFYDGSGDNIKTWNDLANFKGYTIYENCNIDDGAHAISFYKDLIEALQTKK